jgi:stearoyl-CoA desaturase (delta-9 desaturase)
LVIIAWTPFFSNTFVNGVGHWWGYRNTDTRDKTKNFSPIGLFICGEEMHNNHHAEPGNPKFSRRWFEFDPGWLWIKFFESLRLLKIVERTV